MPVWRIAATDMEEDYINRSIVCMKELLQTLINPAILRLSINMWPTALYRRAETTMIEWKYLYTDLINEEKK